MLPLWGDAALRGELRDEDESDFLYGGFLYKVPFNFFSVTLRTVRAPAGTFQDRIMDALGSKQNPGPMRLMTQAMNQLKKQVSVPDVLNDPRKPTLTVPLTIASQLWVNYEALVSSETMENTVILANTLTEVKEGKEYIRRVSLSLVVGIHICS